MNGLKSGDVARRADVNVETVRFYERQGLLPEPPRTPSGYRQYDEEHVRRIRFIKRAQGLGFTLREIADLLALKVEPGAKSRDVKALAAQKIAEIDVKIHDLTRIKATLETLHAACDGEVPIHDCPILLAFDGGERGQEEWRKGRKEE